MPLTNSRCGSPQRLSEPEFFIKMGADTFCRANKIRPFRVSGLRVQKGDACDERRMALIGAQVSQLLIDAIPVRS